MINVPRKPYYTVIEMLASVKKGFFSFQNDLQPS